MKFILLFLIVVFAFAGKSKEAVYIDSIPCYESLNISSRFVNEKRVINIWTPPNYAQNRDSLPVLYILDGGINEDFAHLANTLDMLIKQGNIPKLILVGIENTDRRRDFTGPTEIEYDLKHVPNPGGAGNFRKFIKNELFPTIDKKYRTTSIKGIIGESAAGLFVIETFILEADMFNYYVAMDPALWYNRGYLVERFEELCKSNIYKNTKLWFAGSGAVDINPYTKELNRKIKKMDIELVHQYVDEPKEKHSTIFRATKEKALIWIFNESK